MQRLTKAEEEVMQVIWAIEPCLVSDILSYLETELGQEKPPHSSISSIVRILEKKGFVDHKAYGRTHEYFAVIAREDYSRQSLQKLVSDYFEGSVQNLVSFLVQDEKLDQEELSKLLSQLDDDDHNPKAKK